ncbi:MAG: guanylate kinase [Candidatus Cloacimonetes bacterium]|nr:guanylate kinase [Candidatus Cloacimonadota bacterium]
MAFKKNPFLIILSAPSGGGKSTILGEILQKTDKIEYSVSYTTRNPRGIEKDGVHYHFVDEDSFIKRQKTGDFLEYAQFAGNYYGTSISYIKSRLASGKHVIMDIEVQGAAQISCTNIPLVKIFILPPSLKVLKERLIKRNTDTPEEIEKRLKIARSEITQIPNYHYLVINDELADAVEDVWRIILAEENKVDRYSYPDKVFLNMQ